MIDYAYEDLETEAVREQEENEKYEAECAGEPFEPTTKAQRVKEAAEVILKVMMSDADKTSTDTDRALCRLIIHLADAVDEAV